MKRCIIFFTVLIISGCGSYRGKTPSDVYQTSAPLLVYVNAENMNVEVLKAFKVKYEVQVQKGVFAEVPEFALGITTLRVLDVKKKKETEGSSTIYETEIKLIADFEGAYVIPSFPIPYTTAQGGKGEVRSPAVYIVAGWPKELTAGMSDIVDIKDVILPPHSVSFYLIVFLTALGIFSAVMLYLFIRRRRRTEDLEPVRSPREVALERLEKLEKSQLPEKGDFRNFYFALSEIFRRFVEEMYSFPALEMTTEELVKRLAEFPIKTHGIREFLELSDLPKYAGETLDTGRAYAHLKLVRRVIEEAGGKEAEDVEV